MTRQINQGDLLICPTRAEARYGAAVELAQRRAAGLKNLGNAYNEIDVCFRVRDNESGSYAVGPPGDVLVLGAGINLIERWCGLTAGEFSMGEREDLQR